MTLDAPTVTPGEVVHRDVLAARRALRDLPTTVHVARRRLGLSLRALSVATGVSYNALSRYERGRELYHSSVLALLDWLVTVPPWALVDVDLGDDEDENEDEDA